MAENALIFYVLILTSFCVVTCQEDRTCPLYGCTFAGTFSYRADVPEAIMTIRWVSPFVSKYMPDALGCVGNEMNLVCPSLTPSFSGYVSINSQSGQAVWRDDVLRDPTLPIMDRNGEIIGSDGYELVRYTADGQSVKPEVHLNPPLHPIYSLTISDTGLVLIVSKSGQIATYDTDGMQVSSIWLNGTVERFGGTFIPMTQPVLYRSRAYILTQFRPFNIKPPDLGMQRLYAIDIITNIIPRLEIAWVYNFEVENLNSNPSTFIHMPSKKDFAERFEVEEELSLGKKNRKPLRVRPANIRNSKEKPMHRMSDFPNSDPEPVRLIEATPLVMYNADLSTVYINLPPSTPILPKFSHLWALKDLHDNPELVFRKFNNVSRMGMFEKRGKDIIKSDLNDVQPRLHQKAQKMVITSSNKEKAGIYFIWAIGADSETIMKISPFEGTILDSVNISALVKAPAVLTSDLMVTRAYDQGDDVLLMGISVPIKTQTKEFSLVCTKHKVKENTMGLLVALKGDNLLWMIATPDNTEVRGQIISIPVDSENNKFIAFSGNKQKSYIFALS